MEGMSPQAFLFLYVGHEICIQADIIPYHNSSI